MEPHILQGRYQLHEILGSGGMGTVYSATDRLTGDTVALKQVTAPTDILDLGSEKSKRTNMARKLALAQEFQTLATLRHPHIITVLDYGFDEMLPFFTMDFLPAALTLRDAALNASNDQRIDMLVQLLQALSYLHRRGILHRDLKPANVLVSDGVVKVLDFGLAVKRGHIGGMSGTIAYMAPEVLREEAPSEASDLYSVGVMAYEIFAGSHPYQSTNAASLITDILSKSPDMTPLRSTSSLSDVIKRLLEKDCSARYQNAEDALKALHEAAERPLQPESAAIRESFLQAAQFVGREAELGQLGTAMSETIESKKGALYLIGGESGAGKSRLLDEIRIRALVEGFAVLRGQSVAEGSAASYDLWRDPVRRLLLDVHMEPLEASIIKPLVPDISKIIGQEVVDAPPLEASAMHQRLSRVIVGLFRRTGTPILLILEDLQWAGEALSMLRALINALSDIPVLIVGSYRVDEAPELPDQFSSATVLSLGRLKADDVAMLSKSMLGQNAQNSQVVDFLQRETEGNAFFLVEVVRALAEEAGSLSEVGQTTLPVHIFAGGMRSVIQRRLARVPTWGSSLLEAAAIAGRGLDLAILQPLAQARGVNLDDWITTCANIAIIDRADDKWRFAHDKFREALLSALLFDRVSELHREVAQTIESVYPNNERFAAKLVDHYRNAGNADSERKYALIAGDAAMRISAFVQALQHFQRALELLPESAETERLSVLLRLTEAYHYMDEFETAKTHLKEVIVLADKHNNPTAKANALFRLYQISVAQGDYQTAYDHSSNALPLAEMGGDKSTLARVRFAIGDPRPRKIAISEAIESLELSLMLARECGDIMQEIHTLNRLGAVLQTERQFERSQHYLEECRDLALRVGNRERAIAALINIGAASWYQENFEAAYQFYQEALTVARDTGNRVMLVDSLNNVGLAAVLLDKIEEAETVFKEALHVARLITSVYGMMTSLIGFAALLLRKGDLEQGLSWMGMVWHHPSGTESLHQDIEVIRKQLIPELSDNAFRTGMETGRSLHSDELIATII